MARYGNKPRIIVEESPWANLIQSLPETALSFIKLQNQLAYNEAEKQRDRDHQMNMINYRNSLSQYNQLTKDLETLKLSAIEKGIEIEKGLSNIEPLYTSSNQGTFTDDFYKALESKIGVVQNAKDSLGEFLTMEAQGRKAALILDKNYDMSISPSEIDEYIKNNPDQEMSESFFQGVKNFHNDPKNKTIIKNTKIKHNTQKVLNLLGNKDLFPSEVTESPYLQAAQVQFIRNPNSSEIEKNIGKIFTEAPTAAKTLLESTEQISDAFASSHELAGSQFNALDKEFTKGLAYTGQESITKGAMANPKAVKIYQKKISQNFATFFSGETMSGISYKGVKKGLFKRDHWISKEFEKLGGWDDYEYAVREIIDSPKFDALLANREELKNAFNWSGRDDEEGAADNFFMTMVDQYKLLDSIDNQSVFGSDFFNRLELGDPVDKVSGAEATSPDTTIDQNIIAPVGDDPESSRTAIKNPEVVFDEKVEETQSPSIFGDAAKRFRDLNTQMSLDLAAQKSKAGSPRRFNETIARNKAALDSLKNLDNSVANAINSGARNVSEQNEMIMQDFEPTIGSTDEVIPTEVESLVDIYSDPDTPDSVSTLALQALSYIDSTSQAESLVNAVQNSPAILNQFKSVGQNPNIIAILEQWESEGKPDVGDWLIDNFEGVEPEFIR